MTAQEFSNEFDVLYNNVNSNQAPGLDEYEKSVFLTKALNEIVKNYFTSTPGGNKYQEGFNASAKRQIDFSTLMVLRSNLLERPGTISSLRPTGIGENIYGTAPEAVLGDNPEWLKNILFIVSERVIVIGNSDKFYLSIPIKLSELTRLLSKPYTRPLKNLVWRVVETFNNSDIKGDDSNNENKGFRFILHDNDELLLESDNITYLVSYVRKPKPILLADFSKSGLSIEGDNGSILDVNNPCELNSELHPEILLRAVELAKAAYTGDINSTIEMGKRSE